ncbi:hypothetical protein MLD38_033833 [Melastoma candidum]|uniref:Uncharacterized protein n=1 Tax=Melastoma candidum TaxID=119954 RepID=A0ACB9M7Z9_9MYRT|nr:hypothetical protein MLD38_033833 [Melastoma candidum]
MAYSACAKEATDADSVLTLEICMTGFDPKRASVFFKKNSPRRRPPQAASESSSASPSPVAANPRGDPPLPTSCSRMVATLLFPRTWATCARRSQQPPLTIHSPAPLSCLLQTSMTSYQYFSDGDEEEEDDDDSTVSFDEDMNAPFRACLPPGTTLPSPSSSMPPSPDATSPSPSRSGHSGQESDAQPPASRPSVSDSQPRTPPYYISRPAPLSSRPGSDSLFSKEASPPVLKPDGSSLLRMEDEDPIPIPRNGPIREMDSVVATVSGYRGSDRFKLIKLVSLTGASYVGALNRATTHMICWKFEGRKYEMAKRFRTVVVNHRWVEDCLARGERLPELTYLLKSGEEVGPLQLQVPDGIKEKKYDSLCRYTESVQRKMELEIECLENDQWNASHLLTEGSDMKQLSVSLKRGRRNTAASGEFDYGLSPISENRENGSSHSTSSSRRRRANATARLRTESTSRTGLAYMEEVIDNGNEDINDMECWNLPVATNSLDGSCEALIRDKSSAENTRADVREAGQTDNISKMTKSMELSCVICWTDFSSTRGVLPCGHRFCYSCIRDWADHMTRSKNNSTCPLCKTSFMCIMKVEDAAGSDQKTYSQTIPHDPSTNVYVLSEQEFLTNGAQLSSEPVCSRCEYREPEELLVMCHLCQTRCIHSYCLDPPMFPWTCSHCKDLQMLFHLPR